MSTPVATAPAQTSFHLYAQPSSWYNLTRSWLCRGFFLGYRTTGRKSCRNNWSSALQTAFGVVLMIVIRKAGHRL